MAADPKQQPTHGSDDAKIPKPALPPNVNDPQDEPGPAAIPDNHQPHRDPFDL